MTLFHEDGHITQEGLHAILDGTLDELQSLEASEHLSFCDACLEQYTDLLQEDVLMDPPTPLREGVLRRMHRRALRVVFNKYTTVAAAAVLAVALWGSGFLPTLAKQVVSAKDARQATSQQEKASGNAAEAPAEKGGQRFGDQLNNATNTMAVGLNNFFQKFTASSEDKQPDARAKQADGGKQDAASVPASTAQPTGTSPSEDANSEPNK